ncbi:GyrI-like domain-containing protein [Patescibacteria group bacterium]
MEEVSIVEVPSQKVIGLRQKGSYKDMAQMIPKLMQYASEKGVSPAGPPAYICHEKSMKAVKKADEEGSADIEIVVPVEGDVEGSDVIKSYELAGGKMAKLIHKGPYSGVSPSYEQLFKWIYSNGYRVAGETREVYINDPNQVPESELMTELYAPVVEDKGIIAKIMKLFMKKSDL